MVSKRFYSSPIISKWFLSSFSEAQPSAVRPHSVVLVVSGMLLCALMSLVAVATAPLVDFRGSTDMIRDMDVLKSCNASDGLSFRHEFIHLS